MKRTRRSHEPYSHHDQRTAMSPVIKIFATRVRRCWEGKRVKSPRGACDLNQRENLLGRHRLSRKGNKERND